MRTQIKICGITNEIDAQLAVQFGADLLGYNFYPSSPRYIDPREAKKIIKTLPKKVIHVGLFVNTGINDIHDTLNQCPLNMIQLHGDETNEQCNAISAFGLPVMKALRIRTPSDMDRINEYDTENILLDAYREELYGGTGHSFDWSWIRQHTQKKIFLAGGIRPDNIIDALRVGTYGIDLCSGVEKEPGIKDRITLKDLFQRISEYYENKT